MDKAVEAAARVIFDHVDGLDLGLDWPDDFLPDHKSQIVSMLQNAITAADVARAVTDEEMIKALRPNCGWRDTSHCRLNDCNCEYQTRPTRDAIHAAGFKVIRG